MKNRVGGQNFEVGVGFALQPASSAGRRWREATEVGDASEPVMILFRWILIGPDAGAGFRFQPGFAIDQQQQFTIAR